MKKLSLALNTLGLSVSFICFLHCVLVILVFAGIMSPNIYLINLFEEPDNHALLILSGFLLACLSQIKINNTSKKILRENSKMNIQFAGLQSKRLIGGGLLLGLSFFFTDITAELLVIMGAMTLLSMHAAKLFKLS